MSGPVRIAGSVGAVTPVQHAYNAARAALLRLSAGPAAVLVDEGDSVYVVGEAGVLKLAASAAVMTVQRPAPSGRAGKLLLVGAGGQVSAVDGSLDIDGVVSAPYLRWPVGAPTLAGV